MMHWEKKQLMPLFFRQYLDLTYLVGAAALSSLPGGNLCGALA